MSRFQSTYNKRSRSPSPLLSNEKDQPKKVGKITIDQNMCIVQVVSSEQMRTIAAIQKVASTTTSSTPSSEVDYTDTEIGRDTPENHDQFPIENMHESIEETDVNVTRSSYIRYSQIRTRSQSKSRDCSTRAQESEIVNRRSRSNSSMRAGYQESERANRNSRSNSRECSHDRSNRLYKDDEMKLTSERGRALQKNPTIFEVSNSGDEENANIVSQGSSQSNSCNIDNVQNVEVIKVNVKPNILSKSFQTILFLTCLFFFPCYYDAWRLYAYNIVRILVSLSVLLFLFANLCTCKVYFPRMFGEVNPYKTSSIET